MTFALPQLFWLLLVPAALLAWDLTHRRRAAQSAHPKILRAEAGARSLRFTTSDKPAIASVRPRIWLCIGLALVIGALARPQWGRLEEPVFDQSREILLAVDLSRSMLTTDVPPSRLDRAKLLIQSLLEKLAGERVGLIVFSGTAFLQSPLSADYEILREFLPALGPDFLPEGGSNYGAMIETAIQAFSATSAADRFLIVLSDGEATDESWKERVDELKQKNVRVLSLGVGTPAGGMIPDGDGGFVKDERGAVVLSRLGTATLEELARATGGVFRDASAWFDLSGLVNETVEAGRKGKFVEKNTVRLAERFQWPLAVGLWCLLVSLCYEFPVRPRPRDLQRNAPGSAAARAAPVPGIAALVLFAGLLAAPPPASAAAKLARPSAEAAPTDSSALAKIVGRLSTAEKRTARDWAELSRETITWGSRLQSEQQTVPEGPVRDALAAVDLGAKLDPDTADWPKLREELEALLKKPEDEKKDDPQNQQQQDQQQNQQKDSQPKQDRNQQKADPKQPRQDDPNEGPSPDERPPEDSNRDQQPADKKSAEEKSGQPPPKESNMGDMKEPSAPPPPPADSRKVGGAREKETPAEQLDPSLALPLQKLEQLKNQDSPAQLFQLMDPKGKSEKKKPAKDW